MDDLNLIQTDSEQIKKKKGKGRRRRKTHTFINVKAHGVIQCENPRKGQNHYSSTILFIGGAML